MYRALLFYIAFIAQFSVGYAQSPTKTGIDVCVYGGTSAGVIAAYTAAKIGKSVVLIEPGNRLGGLSSGGLGFTDIGNKYVVTGLARDFYRRIGQHYGRFEQWTFEPKVAEAIFLDYVKRGNFKVVYNNRLKRITKSGNHITAIELENSLNPSLKTIVIKAAQFIDCTYEGDLMAKAGVSYTTGREANSVYNETVNGVQLKTQHQFPDGIDPYKIPGRPGSGLLWGISKETLASIGSGDKKIQSYNFRLCLTNDPANLVEITKPLGYDSTHYELLLRFLEKKPAKDLGAFLKLDMMPGHKTDINNNGPFSTDMIGMNYAYPDGDYATRAAITKAHEVYTKGFLYFIGHDPRMPEHLRNQMLKWGYPKDEYTNNGNFTLQMYVREARRMLGVYVMTEANCLRKEVVDDGVGMGAYNMDSHNAERVVLNGMVKNEGDVQLRGISPYPIAYRSITPKSMECNNLLVPVCLSASHMAYGSIRMEPVFMVLAQSAAAAACQAIDKKVGVQQIDIKQLQAGLTDNPLVDHSTPEILVDNDDTDHIIKTGGWKRETNGGYGPSFLLDTTKTPAGIKFMPQIKKAGKYQVYVYVPKVPHSATITPVQIFDGQNTINKSINKNDVQVVGQTSGEWVSMGISRFSAGTRAYVQISNQGADGAVVADAVLLVAADNE
ncbi:FAD-dependent oxidoreductase [Mucilaginibacter sp. UR6-11]|uniref:FAD-dependent oxidoreductase n=1 Tax=Mucilaginibacter sp. UR6-11 TaxID=1435644 RepID=UPI001E441B45|nr:FAD-dependent oxidoreductase [Mucilaginibacter sp. UR6-11]MCC8423712.1 FAD-dependent oxidoreductase [Mucilaginibacter sp. UR6-11]